MLWRCENSGKWDEIVTDGRWSRFRSIIFNFISFFCSVALSHAYFMGPHVSPVDGSEHATRLEAQNHMLNRDQRPSVTISSHFQEFYDGAARQCKQMIQINVPSAIWMRSDGSHFKNRDNKSKPHRSVRPVPKGSLLRIAWRRSSRPHLWNCLAIGCR